MARHPERRSADRRKGDRRTVKVLDLGPEILGYRIEARDGYVGRAADFCIEEESWVVTGLLARRHRLVPWGKRIFVPLNTIARIDQGQKTIYVTPTRDEVRRGSRRSPRDG
jgi:hypothetical protein